jgi:hypothetical protein
MPLFLRPGLGGPRIGRPGLLGTAARTAVIAGTATAVSGGMQRRAAERSQERAEADAYENAAAAPAAPPAASAADHRIQQLQQLAALHQQGVLTDAELAAQKSAILAGG